MDNMRQDKFEEWNHKKTYIILVPFNNIKKIYNRIRNINKVDEYVWEYDNSVADCDCVGTYNSPPCCKHFNKLIRRKK